MMKLPLRIAQEFSVTLNRWLGTEKMIEVDKRNQNELDPHICHSHDFCDANMAMAEAFQKIVGHDADVHSGTDVALWTEAWNMAKRRGFSADVKLWGAKWK